jgi:hypothetical protein
MDRVTQYLALFGFVAACSTTGCYSPYHADRGALAGGLLGAGTGAIIGDAMGGKALPGAAIGAGLGAVGGGLIGQGMDETEARNRAMIEQQMGRQVAAGAVTTNDVIAMTRAGVADELIVNHIRAHGVAAPLQAGDLIQLQQQGVSARVIAAMQAPPQVVQQPVVVQPAPAPVVVEEYHYVPRWGPRPYYRPPRYHRPRPRPGVSWGISFRD